MATPFLARLSFGAILGAAAFLLLASSVSAQVTLQHDFRNEHFDADQLRYDSDESMRYVTPEKEGLRIRFAPPDVPKAAVGVRWKTNVIGDFEATMRYEILKIERPTKGYGIGAELYFMLENPLRKQPDGIAFARLMTPKGGSVLGFSHRANDENEKRISKSGKNDPATSATDRGRLRMTRNGNMLTASIAEGDSETFKEQFRTEIGDANIRMVRIAGLPASDPKATLDLRILDIQLKGNLPGLEKFNVANNDPQPAQVHQPQKQADAPDQSRSGRWFLLIAILLVMGMGVLLGLVLFVVWLRKAASPNRTAKE